MPLTPTKKLVVLNQTQLVLHASEGPAAIALLVVLFRIGNVSLPAKWISTAASVLDVIASVRATMQLAQAVRSGLVFCSATDYLLALLFDAALLSSYVFAMLTQEILVVDDFDEKRLQQGPSSKTMPGLTKGYRPLLFPACILTGLHLLGIVFNLGLIFLARKKSFGSYSGARLEGCLGGQDGVETEPFYLTSKEGNTMEKAVAESAEPTESNVTFSHHHTGVPQTSYARAHDRQNGMLRASVAVACAAVESMKRSWTFQDQDQDQNRGQLVRDERSAVHRGKVEPVKVAHSAGLLEADFGPELRANVSNVGWYPRLSGTMAKLSTVTEVSSIYPESSPLLRASQTRTPAKAKRYGDLTRGGKGVKSIDAEDRIMSNVTVHAADMDGTGTSALGEYGFCPPSPPPVDKRHHKKSDDRAGRVVSGTSHRHLASFLSRRDISGKLVQTG